MDEPIAVTADDLVVVRGGATVLPGISLAVEHGRITGLLGPSGCGKSTLMRAIVGVQIVAAGPSASSACRRAIRACAGGSATSRRRRACTATSASRRTSRYFARIAGVPDAQADEALATVGLEPMAGRRVDALSGGQRARVSLAAALLSSPELLVLDEPTVGLDPVLRNELWGTFHRLAAAGTTLLVSSHVMDEAARCDTLLLMREGRILAHEAPAALLARTGTADIEAAFLALVAP